LIESIRLKNKKGTVSWFEEISAVLIDEKLGLLA